MVISPLAKLLGDDKCIYQHPRHWSVPRDQGEGATFAVGEPVGAGHAAVTAQSRHLGPAAALPRVLVTGAVQGPLLGALTSCKRGGRTAAAAFRASQQQPLLSA